MKLRILAVSSKKRKSSQKLQKNGKNGKNGNKNGKTNHWSFEDGFYFIKSMGTVKTASLPICMKFLCPFFKICKLHIYPTQFNIKSDPPFSFFPLPFSLPPFFLFLFFFFFPFSFSLFLLPLLPSSPLSLFPSPPFLPPPPSSAPSSFSSFFVGSVGWL